LFEGGFSDAYYLRLTTPKQQSLVVGTSRAAQGIMPTVLNKMLSGHYTHPVFNYAFTVTHSPYGKAYFKSIKNKLDTTVRDGLFIVTVDPWSLSASRKENETHVFEEQNTFMGGVANVSANPNLDYLLNYYGEPFYTIISDRFFPRPMHLHEDGWLQVTVAMDSNSVAKRKTQQLREYTKKAKELQFSDGRLDFLEKTLGYLKGHGDVFLVRLPVSREMLQVENSLKADFNSSMQSLASRYAIPFLDMTQSCNDCIFNDGHHLNQKSSPEVTAYIAEQILSKENFKRDLMVGQNTVGNIE